MKNYSKQLYEDIYKENFSFWKNWSDFLEKLNQNKIDAAKVYLREFIGDPDSIQWKTVIDFWSGSGLMSLGFCLLWAKKVVSIDIDENSLKCTKYLHEKYAPANTEWIIEKGSVLDAEFIKSLGTFDIVYSWWVIHHSWDMWKGLTNILSLLQKDSLLYIAIYNKCTVALEGTSEFWVKLKRLYSGNKIMRPLIKGFYTLYLVLGITVHGKNPFWYIKNYEKNALRGMDFFTDIEDWLGGYPYEYASYDEITQFYKEKWLTYTRGAAVRSIACNEFLFKK